MHWAVKQMRLQRLLQSKSISISVDDRKDYRLLRYRCSANPGPRSEVQGPRSLQEWSEMPALAVEGLLGVYRVGADVPENTLESHDLDKSQAVADSIRAILKRAAQDPEGQVDRNALKHLQENIRHFASDQAGNAAKAGRILASQGKFPNMIYVNFDAAHQIRIAAKDPLHALPEFDRQWHRLFGGKSALLPAIHHSKVWQSKLMACQREVLKVHGAQGGVERAIQSLSFALHRFDSTATPLFKFCCLTRSIALLCGMQAADVAHLYSSKFSLFIFSGSLVVMGFRLLLVTKLIIYFTFGAPDFLS